MNAISSDPRVLALIIAAWYFIIGYGSAALDPSVPAQMRFVWRLAAWIACGVAYAAHIIFLRFKFRKPPVVIALHAAMAVALGGFLLALVATIHAARVPSHAPYWQFLIALLAWPIITAVPAFLVAFAVTAMLARVPRKRVTD